MNSIIYLLWFFICTIFLNGCKNEIKTLDSKQPILYTFSRPIEPDINSNSDIYNILYKNSVAIDTIFGVYKTPLINDSSILYLQIKGERITDLEEIPYGGSDILYKPSNLILYDNRNFNVIKPPLFNIYFSSFDYKDDLLFYWGIDDGSLYACCYNLTSKNFRKLKIINEAPGTDCRVLITPRFVEDKVVFEVDDEIPTIIEVDFNLTKIIPSQKKELGGGWLNM